MNLTAREFLIYLAALIGSTARNRGEQPTTGHAHNAHDEAESYVREWRLRRRVAKRVRR